MKGLILLANGVEENEAICTIDILVRAGIEVVKATPNEHLDVTTSHGITIKADCFFDKVKATDYDFLVIPGGSAVETVWHKHHSVTNLIQDFIDQKKLVAAICAAPSLIGKMGAFKNEKYTCFPGYEEFSIAGKKCNKNVVVSNNFITAKSMYYTIDFALAIVEKLLGKEKSHEILLKIKGNV